MNGMGTGKLIVAPDRVHDEIGHLGSPGLKHWAKTNRSLFMAHDVPLQTEANNIQRRFPGLIDPNAVHDEADRYIIALAVLRKLTVVTHETSVKTKKRPPRTHYIPDVCRELNVRCLTLVEMMREQKWKF
jgi:hypothetical protein